MTTSPSRSYRATAPGVLAAESAAERARRNGISPALATSREARAAGPTPLPTLKGAVRVERFPEKSKYPFRQIADDGGIWRIDPAEFKVTPAAITQAAPKWARGNGLAAKTVVDDGMVYVQFTPAGDA